MSKLLTRTKSSVAAKKLAQNLGGKFEPAQASVAGTVVGANLVSVGGQQYRSIGVDGDAGASVALRNIGTPAVTVYGPATGGAALASVGSNGGNTSSGGDHNPVALATPSGLQFADTLTQIGLALALPSSLGASSINAVGAGHSHAIDATIARSAITLTAGDGLSGLGDLTANRTVAIELSATSGLELTGASPDKMLQLADTVAGDGLTIANKIFAVGVSGLGLSVGADAVTLTSSSNPGAAASILASGATGKLTIPLFEATTSIKTPLLTTASGDLTIDPTGVVKFPVAQTLTTANFDSSFPILGWQINEVAGVTGQSAITIGKIAADELSVKVFVADETRVDRANQYWTKSYGIVAEPFTTPAAISGTVTVTFEDSPALAGAIFAANDWVLIRQVNVSSGISTLNIWGQVSAYADAGDGIQSWTFTLRSGPTATSVKEGTIAIDFGASGDALIHLSVLDAAGAPYIKMRKWSGSDPYTPANLTTYVQIGELASTGNASMPAPSGYGLYARSGAAAGRGILIDDNGLLIQGADLKLYNGANQTVNISYTGESFWLGLSAADKRLEWNGSTLSVIGAITANTGYIGGASGWAIASEQLTSTNIGLYAGESARLQVGANSDIAGVAATALATDVALWAGDTYANRASADFRVRADGQLYATGAILSGAITATSGTITGDLTVTGGGKLSASGVGIVLTATGMNIGIYPNISPGAAVPDNSKSLTWWVAPSAPTGAPLARMYASHSHPTDPTIGPYWSIVVAPNTASSRGIPSMSIWNSNENFLWFENITNVIGLPGISMYKGGTAPITAMVQVGANSAFWLDSSSEFKAWTHLLPGEDFAVTAYNLGSTTKRWGTVYANEIKAGNIEARSSSTYDIGKSGEPFKKIYVDEVVALTITGGTALAGHTWQRGDVGDMYIKSYTDTVSRTLFISNSGTASMHLDVEGNITLGGNVDGVDLSGFKTSYDSHNHDTRYYTETELQTSGSATVHWGNLSNKPTTFAPSAHALVGSDHNASGLTCLLYTSPSPRDRTRSRMPSSA